MLIFKNFLQLVFAFVYLLVLLVTQLHLSIIISEGYN